jgi:hypothetical protein
MGSVTITVSLDSDRDRDLMRWIESIPKRHRSETIRDTLRQGLGRVSGVTLGEVYQAVKDLERKLSASVVVTETGPGEPPDIAAALDSLGL